MGKKINFVLSSGLALGAIGAAFSELLLYLLSNKNADPSFAFAGNEEDMTELDKAIEEVRKEDLDWLLSKKLTHYHITSDDGF